MAKEVTGDYWEHDACIYSTVSTECILFLSVKLYTNIQRRVANQM